MFSAGVPVSYPCDNSNNSFLESENYIAMTGVPPKYFSVGHCNPECRMYMDAKKLMNQRNYIMKHKKIMDLEVKEIRRELQESQRSHLEKEKES